MMKKLIALAVQVCFGRTDRNLPRGIPRGRAKVRDTAQMAFTYRMPAGFPGDVNRTHPVSIEPCLIDPTLPPLTYGIACLVDATSHGVRRFDTGDTAIDTPWGVTVRPYPIQQALSASAGAPAAFGSATPPTNTPIDVMRAGYIMVAIPAGQAPVKGGAVFVWCAVASGAHIQGGFEATASGGNTAALDPEKYQFNGGVDAGGNVEISFNV